MASSARRPVSTVRVAAPSADPARWRMAVLIAVLALGLAAAWWIHRHGGGDIELQELDAAAVAGLAADDAGDRQIMVHLTGRLYHGRQLGDWRELSAPARHLWATITVEDRVLHGPMPAASGDGPPTLADAAAGYEAFGAAAMAAVMRAKASGHGERFRADFTAALSDARQARNAYQRSHAADIARALP